MSTPPPEQALNLKHTRIALDDFLPCNDYQLIYIQTLGVEDHHIVKNGCGVAYSVKDCKVLVLVDNSTGQHAPAYLPLFLLGLATALTGYLNTFVVPAQSSRGLPFADGKGRGPFVVYQFELADSPAFLQF